LQNLFHLTAIRPLHFIYCLGISILATMWFEIYKSVSGKSLATGRDQIQSVN